jgi:hypothetical protein
MRVNIHPNSVLQARLADKGRISSSYNAALNRFRFVSAGHYLEYWDYGDTRIFSGSTPGEEIEVKQVNRMSTKLGQGATWAAKLLLTVAAVAGLLGVIQPAVAPATAQAYVIQGPGQLGWGRGAILFNHEETLKIATGGLPAMPPANPVVAAFDIARAGLGAIAINYYNRGLCSAYLISAIPWDNQGFMSRKC